ncbi:MAG: hypothetical protein B7Y41_07670 [Hydrogenophilales bacterium 28-61-23]|nr:MAG: hypothetical protein B7Y41_07670 [Hydrogenophilales bacterium 28-61-23]
MPVFLTEQVVLAIHRDQVGVFGGAHGIRDTNLLASAIGQPEQVYAYTGNLYQAAAAYGVSLARNHPFLDGNKRIAADCMLTFLMLNGRRPTMTNTQLFECMLRVAVGELEREPLAEWLEQNSTAEAL